MCDPQLHIGGIGRVADIERVEQQDATVITLLQLLYQPLQTKFAHAIELRGFQSERFPLGKRERGRADLDAIVVVRRAIGFEGIFRFAVGIDLALGAVDGIGRGGHERISLGMKEAVQI